MKTFLTFLCLASSSASAQFASISDTSFRNFLVLNYPSCFNEQKLLDTTCTLVTEETHLALQLIDQYETGPYKRIEGLQYFKSLQSLSFSFLDLEVGTLPPSLKRIRQYFTPVTYLTPIHDALTHLELHYTGAVFPFSKLPSSLSYLHVEMTTVAEIPELPNGLDSLYCAGNTLLERCLSCQTASLNLSPEATHLLHYPKCPIT